MVRLITTVNPRVRYTGGARPRVRHCAPRFSCRHLLFFFRFDFFFGLGFSNPGLEPQSAEMSAESPPASE